MKAKITDVAQKANVSISTVSHVLNHTRFVSEETRKKVMDAVEELGYSPDASGRTFRTGKKMMIGLVVPDITNSVFAALIEDVDDVISKQGYNLVISNTRDCLKMEKQALRNLASGVVDGIVIASTSEDFQTIKRQIPDKFPMIFMDRVLPDRNYDSVILDCQEATAKMLEEMIQNGFRKIGFLVGLPQISPTYERVKVYQQILKQYEIPETEQYVRYIDRKKDTYDVAGELVEAGCTAIIATNTAMTHSVLNYVEDRNLKLSTCKHFFLRIPAKFLIWKLNFNLFFTVYFHVKYGFISMCKNIIGRHVCLFDFYIRPCIRCYTKSQCTIQI